MSGRRRKETLKHGTKKRTGATCRFHQNGTRQVPVGRVPDEIENHFDDPAAREHLAVVADAKRRRHRRSLRTTARSARTIPLRRHLADQTLLARRLSNVPHLPMVHHRLLAIPNARISNKRSSR